MSQLWNPLEILELPDTSWNLEFDKGLNYKNPSRFSNSQILYETHTLTNVSIMKPSRDPWIQGYFLKPCTLTKLWKPTMPHANLICNTQTYYVTCKPTMSHANLLCHMQHSHATLLCNMQPYFVTCKPHMSHATLLCHIQNYYVTCKLNIIYQNPKPKSVNEVK